ncbi:MAG: mitochondrial fission ELM1 family protein [Rhodospirillaceae bacterium]|nr:mitochondrial fission ELM1 family protein [Rhodospirillaceae bacterium]
MAHQPLIWALADDRAGNVAQVLGVAEALNRPFITKEIRYTPLARLPNAVTGARLLGLTVESRMNFLPPWPDVVIAAGRRTAPVARWTKRIAAHTEHKQVLLTHLMNPGRSGADEFDLIAVPHHDGVLDGGDAPNIMRTAGAAHRLNSVRLASAADAWAARTAGMPRPFIALIVGGATHRKPFPAALAGDLGRRVHAMAAKVGGSVLIATSRRTGSKAEQALLASIPDPKRVFLWSQGGDNPYFGFLALADAVVVTGDSVSMCTEACATPGPVYIYASEGMVTPKHARLHRQLFDLGFARPFDGTYTEWRHPPLNPAGDIARAVDDLIRRRFP